MRRGENIYKRSDGRWEGRYIASYDDKGKACYKSIYADSYGFVKERMKELSKEYRKKTKSIFENLTEKWLGSVKLRCKQSTYNKYMSTYTNHLLPEFEGDYIERIDQQRVEGFISKKIELSDKSKTDLLGILKQILKYAENDNIYVDRTIFDLTVRHSNPPIRVLTAWEFRRLEKYLLKKNDLLAAGTYLALYTGLRIGELCALRRDSIDFRTGVLHVDTTMQRMKVEESDTKTKVCITEPKSKCSVRDIPIPRKVLNICRSYFYDLDKESFILSGNEKCVEPRLMRYHFKQYAVACKLESVHFHTLRHTFATRCIERGVDIKSLSEILGHYDVNVTLNRYVHPSLSLKRRNIEKLCR